MVDMPGRRSSNRADRQREESVVTDKARLERLEPFVGEWRLEAPALPLSSELADSAGATFEWTLGGAFLLQRSSFPIPGAPDGLSVIGPDDTGDGYTQHYFDSRGIARLYAMSFDGREWILERHTPDFSDLPFHQRWTGTFSDDDTIRGRWEKGPDGGEWELDFELVYRRVTRRR
jgi:uncharacterized protein DUF1579